MINLLCIKFKCDIQVTLWLWDPCKKIKTYCIETDKPQDICNVIFPSIFSYCCTIPINGSVNCIWSNICNDTIVPSYWLLLGVWIVSTLFYIFSFLVMIFLPIPIDNYLWHLKLRYFNDIKSRVSITNN